MIWLVMVPMWLTVQPAASSRVSAPAARPVVVVLFMMTTWNDLGSVADPAGGADDDADEDEDGGAALELDWAGVEGRDDEDGGVCDTMIEVSLRGDWLD